MKELRCPKCNKRLLDYENDIGEDGYSEVQIICKCKAKVSLLMADQRDNINLI